MRFLISIKNAPEYPIAVLKDSLPFVIQPSKDIEDDMVLCLSSKLAQRQRHRHRLMAAEQILEDGQNAEWGQWKGRWKSIIRKVPVHKWWPPAGDISIPAMTMGFRLPKRCPWTSRIRT